MSNAWKVVCSIDDLKEGLGVCALLENRQIALFRIEDRVFAVSNNDPFSGCNVMSRGLTGDLRGHLVVASPIYKQHFDLETGSCLEDESVSLESYPIEMIEGQVMILLPEASQVA